MKAGDANKLHIFSVLQRMFGAESVITEHRFAAPARQFRFDYAVPAAKLAIEYQGHAGFIGKSGASGHSSITGLTRDCEKSNLARSLGWTVLTFTALFFRYEDRQKHNLTDIETTILNTIARMQEDRESFSKP